MKAAFKHTVVILVALFYCFAVGGTNNGTGYVPDYPDTKTEVTGVADKLSTHIAQTAFTEVFAKYSQPQNFKLSFYAIAQFPQMAWHFVSQPYKQYVMKSQNMHLFTVADIIYPFHSFW